MSSCVGVSRHRGAARSALTSIRFHASQHLQIWTSFNFYRLIFQLQLYKAAPSIIYMHVPSIARVSYVDKVSLSFLYVSPNGICLMLHRCYLAVPSWQNLPQLAALKPAIFSFPLSCILFDWQGSWIIVWIACLQHLHNKRSGLHLCRCTLWLGVSSI